MAGAQPTSLEHIVAEAKGLQEAIQGQGVNAANPKEIVASATKLLGVLDKLQPHINQAQSAFGGQEPVVNQANDLRNKLNRVIASYS